MVRHVPGLRLRVFRLPVCRPRMLPAMELRPQGFGCCGSWCFKVWMPRLLTLRSRLQRLLVFRPRMLQAMELWPQILGLVVLCVLGLRLRVLPLLGCPLTVLRLLVLWLLEPRGQSFGPALVASASGTGVFGRRCSG